MNVPANLPKAKVDFAPPHETLSAALGWAAKGFRVFPLQSRRKEPPKGSSWTETASADPARVREAWQAAEPAANIGVSCDDLIVVDVDAHKNGFATLFDLELPLNTLCVKTPRGGQHYYFRAPAGRKFSNSVEALGPGIDIRSWHGYTLAPGSFVNEPENGCVGPYTIVNEAPMLEAPPSLIERLTVPRERRASATPLVELDTPWAIQRAAEYLADEADAPPEGGRNHALFLASATVKDFGLTEATALELIAEHWNTRLGGPLETAEIEKTVGSAFQNGQLPAGSAHPAAMFKGVVVPPVELKPEARPSNRFALVPFGSVHLSTAPEYWIKGLLPRQGLTVVWGAPKVGKSFFVVDAVLHVALGWSYRGRRVNQGTVVYCALEGLSGFAKRAEAFRLVKMRDALDAPCQFKLMASPLALVSDCKAFMEALEAQLGGERPAILVIDTLNRSFEGGESEDKAMTAYVRAATALIERFHCQVIVVHHCGHNETRMRGHTALIGALDVEIKVEQDTANNVVATVERAKDFASGLEIVSRLEIVAIGVDDEGDPINSCVVQPTEATGDADAVQVFTECLAEITKFEGVAASSDCEIGARQKDLKARFCAQWQAKRNVKAASAEKTYTRTRERLIAEGRIMLTAKHIIVPLDAATL